MNPQLIISRLTEAIQESVLGTAMVDTNTAAAAVELIRKATNRASPFKYRLNAKQVRQYNEFTQSCHPHPVRVVFSHRSGIGLEVILVCSGARTHLDITDVDTW